MKKDVNTNIKSKKTPYVNLNTEGNENLKTYIAEIMQLKQISDVEERELFRELEQYDVNSTDEKVKDKIKEIRNRIVSGNMRFVYSVAKQYAQDETLKDVISFAAIGMFNAFDNFDVNRGNRFCTHALWYMKREINQYFTNINLLINRTNWSKTAKLNRLQDSFFAKEGRMPTAEESLELINERLPSEKKITDIRDVYEVRIDRFDTNFDDENANAFENSKIVMQHTADTVFETRDDNEQNKFMVEQLMKCLTEKEARLISLAYSNKEYETPEIAEIMGISEERVRQIRRGALKKMKAYGAELKAQKKQRG